MIRGRGWPPSDALSRVSQQPKKVEIERTSMSFDLRGVGQGQFLISTTGQNRGVRSAIRFGPVALVSH